MKKIISDIKKLTTRQTVFFVVFLPTAIPLGLKLGDYASQVLIKFLGW